MSRVATATVSLQALQHNLEIVKQFAPQSKILAVIKADAYGHGLLRVADALNGVEGFAVAHYEEAVALRENGIDNSIVLLQGFADEVELALLFSLHVEPVIHSLYQIDILEQVSIPRDTRVWLKLDTGMNRLGIASEELENAWQRLNKISTLQGRINLMSHFANADNPELSFTDEQIGLFGSLTEKFETEKSLANSAGLITWQQSHFQWVRPGIMLYGVSPFFGKQGADHNLKSVMTFRSRIIAINKIKKSQSVGYGSCWQAEEDSCIAVIGCGYGDGYPRHVNEDTKVLIRDHYYPIVGRVSMDMICVNLGLEHQLQVGDEVILWGEGLPVEQIAENAGTIPYELLCQLTSRVRFEVADGET